MPSIETLLVPLDGSELAEAAIPVATTFAEAHGSAINLVRVVPMPITYDGFGGGVVNTPDLLDTLVDSAWRIKLGGRWLQR